MSDKKMLLLWLDFETTGLQPETRDSVIEVAWMYTTESLIQLTPLRQRFTLLAPPNPVGKPVALPDDEEWDDRATHVGRMHAESGLTEAWTLARGEYTEPGHWDFVHSGAELNHLLLSDLGRAVRHGDVDHNGFQVMLAGAGVSHFDQGVLGMHCPAFKVRVGESMMHYRAFDTSVAHGVLGLPDVEFADELAWLGNLMPSLITEDGEVTDLRSWKLTPHRAGSDVIEAWTHAHYIRERIVQRSGVEGID